MTCPDHVHIAREVAALIERTSTTRARVVDLERAVSGMVRDVSRAVTLTAVIGGAVGTVAGAALLRAFGL